MHHEINDLLIVTLLSDGMRCAVWSNWYVGWLCRLLHRLSLVALGLSVGSEA